MNTQTPHTDPSVTSSAVEKSQTLVPQLRFSEFENEWSFDKLKNITSYVDYRGRGPIKSDEGIFLVTAKNIKKGYIDYENSQEYVPIENYDIVMSKGKPKEGDVLFTTEAPLGNVAQVDNPNIALAQRVIKFRGTKELNNRYLLYYMLSTTYQKLISRKAIGSTVQGISGKELHKTKINFPALPEQQKIASFLSSVDTKLQQLTQKKELLEQYKKGVMQQLFSQQLRFKQEDGSDYPDWEKKKLKDVLYEHKTKNTDGAVTEVFSVAKEKGVVNQIEHLGRSYAADTTLHYKVAFPGDIIYTKSPTKDFPFGIIKQNLTGRKGLVSPLYVVTKPQTDSLGFMFHCHFLSWVNVYNYLVPLVQKGAKNTMNINNDDFLNGAKFVLPVSEEEQQKIANYLSSLDTKIESVAQQIIKTQEFKRGLLQQMFV
jgi:type I restriction enzyme S subunit